MFPLYILAVWGGCYSLMYEELLTEVNETKLLQNDVIKDTANKQRCNIFFLEMQNSTDT